jgi:hypothetical protein
VETIHALLIHRNDPCSFLIRANRKQTYYNGSIKPGTTLSARQTDAARRHFDSKANPRTVMEIEEVKSGRHVEIWGKRYSQASSEANTFVTVF